MQDVIEFIEKMAPEAMQTVRERYDLLRQVKSHQPVGRRQLGRLTGLSERTVRTETDQLKNRGFLLAGTAGVVLSDNGEAALLEAERLIPWFYNLYRLSEQIKVMFKLREVFIVPGDSAVDPAVKQSLGRVAAEWLHSVLEQGIIVAVAGGSTLAEAAAAMPDDPRWQDVCIVPARGGLDEEMELQAGTIAAVMARHLGAQYRLLHIPDHMEAEAIELLMKNSSIREVIKAIKSSDILVHGIGSALEMAHKRDLDAEMIGRLQSLKAVGEALRYYYDHDGNIVAETTGIGLEQADLGNIKTIAAVAGGSNKAEAIRAVLKNGAQHILVTDEAAARGIVNGAFKNVKGV